MTPKGLSISEICSIIETCARSGVAVLKFGALELGFHAQTGWERYSLPTDLAASSPGAEMLGAQPPITPEQVQEHLENAELRLRDEQVDEMLLTSPEEFEDALARGELTEHMDGAAFGREDE